jgi:hypothetical protein
MSILLSVITRTRLRPKYVLEAVADSVSGVAGFSTLNPPRSHGSAGRLGGDGFRSAPARTGTLKDGRKGSPFRWIIGIKDR